LAEAERLFANAAASPNYPASAVMSPQLRARILLWSRSKATADRYPRVMVPESQVRKRLFAGGRSLQRIGRGHRIRYGFDHLIELGVALFGLRRGMAPREVAGILVNHRDELRRCYRDTASVLPPKAFEAEWVKGRGALVPIMAEEWFIRMHDRYSHKSGTYELVDGAGSRR
jgi:hypothetical protein